MKIHNLTPKSSTYVDIKVQENLNESFDPNSIYTGLDKVFNQISSTIKNSIEKITSGIEGFTSFDADFKKWTVDFMGKLKENTYKILDIGLNSIKQIAKYFIDCIQLKNLYVSLFKENNIKTKNINDMNTVIDKNLDKKKIEELKKLKDSSPKFKSKLNENKGTFMKFNEFKNHINESKVNEGVFSSVLDFSGKAIDNLKAYAKGALHKWGDKKVTWTKKDLHDALKDVYKFAEEGLNSQGRDALKGVLDIITDEINTGKITNSFGALERFGTLTGITLVK